MQHYKHSCEKGDWSYQKGVIRRNTIVTVKRENTIYNDLKTTLHRKQNSEQCEPYRQLTVNSGARNCKHFLPHQPHPSCHLGNHLWQSEKGQTNQYPKKRDKKTNNDIQNNYTTNQKLNNRITTGSELIQPTSLTSSCLTNIMLLLSY